MNGSLSITGENPFCTRRTRPGSLPFLFMPEIDLEKLLKRLQSNGGWGEIVGPHGSGKSTLLAALIPALQASGWQTQCIELHDGQRRLPVKLGEREEARGEGESLISSPQFMIVVDGYEQLGYLSRFHLKRHCRRRGLGLIVTAHRTTGLPQLYETAVSVELANRVVQELLQNNAGIISPQNIADSFARHEGNLREVLFELYDLVESGKR